ncbi:unnamed protein product [Acanthoscelides obtectus]|uniref:Uncharacterized protein n=1 Tax=Acanthoscelides obtectus TaxID=200917 RepID=A0A9P0K6M5_ACAOB|nr:unnamed protein product [Acanthoscelides obtectus]CAK1662510.1 hypothetical protein AOBTE_LOCUS23187 [Acanthoscelides obtectus]
MGLKLILHSVTRVNRVCLKTGGLVNRLSSQLVLREILLDRISVIHSAFMVCHFYVS